MPLRTSSARKALAASRAAASAWASERPLTMNFATENFLPTLPVIRPPESKDGNLICQAWHVECHVTFCTPLCFTRLCLLKDVGFAPSAQATGSSAREAALAPSLTIASLGFSSSAATPTDSKTSHSLHGTTAPCGCQSSETILIEGPTTTSPNRRGQSPSSKATSSCSPCHGPCSPGFFHNT